MNNNIDLPKMNDDGLKSSDVNDHGKQANNDGIKEMFKYITTKDSKGLLLLALRLIIIVVIILICKFPFDLLREAGTNFFIMFGITITETLLNIWNSIINIIYYVLAIYAFYKIINIRFKNINN